jgi:hypothetical protein
MDPLILFGVQVVLTLIIGFLLVAYLRPVLYRILLDLCGNEVRAQFWLALSRILLIGLPCAFALAYRPEGSTPTDLFFDVAGRLSGNLGTFLVTLIGIGLVVSFFALVAPKPAKE